MPRFSRDVWLLSIACGVLVGAFLGMMQLLKVIYMLRLGFGPEFIGTLFATGSLSFTLSSVPGGTLGGRLGPRPMIRIGAVICILGMILLPFTESVPRAMQALWPLLVQIVSSSGWSVVMVNQVAALMALTSEVNRKGAYALKEALAGLGMLLGTLVGGMLPGLFADLLHVTTAQPAPYRYSLWVAIAMAVIGFLMLLPVRPVPASAGPRAAQFSLRPLLPLLPLFACGFLNQGAVASWKAFYSAYLDREFSLPTALIGTISSIGMFLAVPGALSSSRLARRRGSGYAMMVASLGLAASLFLMGTLGHWIPAGLGTIGMLALTAVWMPSYQVLQMEIADPLWRSLIAGAGSMCMSFGFGTISFSGGYIVAAFGYRRLFLLGTALALSSAALMWTMLRRRHVMEPRRVPQTLG